VAAISALVGEVDTVDEVDGVDVASGPCPARPPSPPCQLGTRPPWTAPVDSRL